MLLPPYRIPTNPCTECLSQAAPLILFLILGGGALSRILSAERPIFMVFENRPVLVFPAGHNVPP